MSRYIPVSPIVFIAVIFFASPSFSFDGPLQVRNQFPLFLGANPPVLEKAALEDSFSVSLSHASVFMVKSSAAWSVALDMEVTELDLRFRKKLRDFLELGVEVPVVSFNSGFMDGFLNDYHRVFGFPDYGRSGRPSNNFLYEVKRQGVLLVKGRSGTGIGDLRLTAKGAVLKEDPAVSFLLDAEFPTGNAPRGFGNGSVDFGTALLIDKRLCETIAAYGNLGVLFPGDLKGLETLKLRTSSYAGAGVEAALGKGFGILGQVLVQASPFPKTGISSLDRPSVLLSIGGRYSSGKSSFELSFTEDPNTAGAPDVSVTLSFKKRL